MNHEVYENPTVDIYRIIDDAIEKKDRSVMIFIGNGSMQVSIQPAGEKPAWIERDGRYICPECGVSQRGCTVYCPECGEKLYMEE
jgi:rubredoxin